MRIMAIPAKIPFAVRGQINAGNVARAVRPLSMALAAEVARSRFLRQSAAWIHPMLWRRLVANRTGQRGVRRNGLLDGDLPVAGAAVLGHVRSGRIVRIVARHAGLAGIVHHGLDLRKARRARRIVAVAERALRPVSRRAGNLLVGRGGMFGRGAVADFAGQPAMIGVGLQRGNVIVAFRTSFGSGIIDVQGGDFIHGLRPVVAIFAEGIRCEEKTSPKKGNHDQNENNRKALDLLRDLRQGDLPFAGWI